MRLEFDVTTGLIRVQKVRVEVGLEFRDPDSGHQMHETFTGLGEVQFTIHQWRELHGSHGVVPQEIPWEHPDGRKVRFVYGTNGDRWGYEVVTTDRDAIHSAFLGEARTYIQQIAKLKRHGYSCAPHLRNSAELATAN